VPGPVVADMGRRLVARIIDGILVFIVLIVLSAILLGGLVSQVEVNEETGEVTGVTALIGAYLGYIALAVILAFGYEVTLIALRGATVGKQLMGVRVVREADGQVPGWGPSVMRWLIPFAGGLVCGIGELIVYISPFFDSSGRNQGWHDKVAHTLVLRQR
jgi:uncharacterized RDD family membrane protein YckC